MDSTEPSHAGITRKSNTRLPTVPVVNGGNVSPDRSKATKAGSLIRVVLAIVQPVQQARLLKLLIDDGVDVNDLDSFGKTALMHAATLGAGSAAQTVLDSGRADVTGADQFGNTAMILACSAGQDAVTRLLLDYMKKTRSLEAMRVHLDTQNKNGDTALTSALKNGHVDCANLISQYLQEVVPPGQHTKHVDNGVREGSAAPTVRRRAKSQHNRSPDSTQVPVDRFSSRKSTTCLLRPSLALEECPHLTPVALSKLHGISLPDLSGSTGSMDSQSHLCEVKSSLALDSARLRLHSKALKSSRIGAKRLPICGKGGLISAGSGINEKVPSDTSSVVKTRWTRRSIQDMIREKRNVAQHGKVQKIFHVDSDGSPSGGEEAPFLVSSSSSSNSTLSDKFRRLFDRRLDYVHSRFHQGGDQAKALLDNEFDLTRGGAILDFEGHPRRSASDTFGSLSTTWNPRTRQCPNGDSRSSPKKSSSFKLPPLPTGKNRSGF